jgi:Ni,Fe-hydrogenase maturation factor
MGAEEGKPERFTLVKLAQVLERGFAVAFRRMTPLSVGIRAVKKEVVYEVVSKTIQGAVDLIYVKIVEHTSQEDKD